jgi:hypothetical protein
MTSSGKRLARRLRRFADRPGPITSRRPLGVGENITVGGARRSYTVAVDLDGAKLLADLQAPDEMALHFGPYGLGGQLRPEDAARFQATCIAGAVLAEDVPTDVRRNFERARKLHLHGVLEYSFFTAAADYVLLVLEGALRLRFVSHYADGMPAVRKGVEKARSVQSFDDVRSARDKGYELRDAHGATQHLPTSTRALLEWARREGLLPGTRSRVVDEALAELRNLAAHPVTHMVLAPPSSAGRIADVAEVINRLWGHDTPGGRLFPSPLARVPRVAALSPERTAAATMRLDQVRQVTDRPNWLYGVFLAVEQEDLIRIPGDGLRFAHRPGFQTTVFPCAQLWEGSWSDLVQAIDAGEFASTGDTVQHLDRLFFIRASEGEIDDPRGPNDLVALAALPDGCWYVIVADSPWDAWIHVRDHGAEEAASGTICSRCGVQVQASLAKTEDAVAVARAAVCSA